MHSLPKKLSLALFLRLAFDDPGTKVFLLWFLDDKLLTDVGRHARFDMAALPIPHLLPGGAL